MFDRMASALNIGISERMLLSPEQAGGEYFDREVWPLTVVDGSGRRHRETFPQEDLEDLGASPEMRADLEARLRELLEGIRTAAAQRVQEPNSFDVFLCYNSDDKTEVKQVGLALKARGIAPWLDEWELRPGFPWQRLLEEQIGQIRSAAIFVGPNGVGPWQRHESDAFLREFVERRCPVIPVLLPGAPSKPALPIFLKSMTWVDFREREPDPMDRLIWGITGSRPPSREPELTAQVRLKLSDPVHSSRGREWLVGSNIGKQDERTRSLMAEADALVRQAGGWNWILDDVCGGLGVSDRQDANSPDGKRVSDPCFRCDGTGRLWYEAAETLELARRRTGGLMTDTELVQRFRSTLQR